MLQPVIRHCLATALEPVHVGAGKERLGPVDMTVVREAATGVPYIPGTALSGALKSHTDLALRAHGLTPPATAASTRNRQHTDSHPIVALFGFTPNSKEAEERPSFRGILDFSDAHLLAAPCLTLLGPVWLSTASRLKDLLRLGDGCDTLGEHYALPSGSTLKPPEALQRRLNFGWCLLPPAPQPCVITVAQLQTAGLAQPVAQRLVLVSDWLFGQLVNDQLETRTSVVINPETGAADTGGLFTYEAVPRGAVFAFTLQVCDPGGRWAKVKFTKADTPVPAPFALVEKYGLPGLATLGIGGLVRRGFGRLQVTILTPTP